MGHGRKGIGLAVAALGVFAALAAAQDVGEHVQRRGSIQEDYYAAGGSVHLLAEVDGDVIVAGGLVDLDVTVTGNVLAAGGEVKIQRGIAGDLFAIAGSLEVRGLVEDDVRVAGGDVTVYARIQGDLIAAGARVTLAPGATVEGRAALAGGRVEVGGNVDKRLLAAGQTVVINGVVNGDAEIEAQELVLGPTARIHGALRYRSPNDARIDPAAQVTGKVEHLAIPLEREMARARWAAGMGLAAALGLAIFVLGAAWFGLFPNFSRAAPGTLAGSPLRSVLAGIVVAAGAPLAGAGLAAVVVGLPIAVLLFLLYPAALLLGLVTTALCLADLALSRMKGESTTGRRLLALLAVAVLLGLLALVPILGCLLILAAVLFGTGAFWLRLLRADGGR
jgi:cytoskeletal protein CcmA (bactofilin family)